MKRIIKISITIALYNLLTACAHHRDVRAGADGVHRVVIQTDDTETASRDAISQANHFCEQRGKSAAFVKEEQKYTGDMDEQSYRNAKRAAKVAKTVGGVVHVHGAEKESSLGGLLGLGGVAGDQALGKGYTVDMRFKCM
ncbi:hypothetical protein GW916_05955 [bacterium]|nr:hypothetical protein [bacterium]